MVSPSVGNISTYALQQQTLKDISLTQQTLADLQGQVSSGKKTNKFSELGDQTSLFLSLDARISKSMVYQQSNTLLQTRIESTDKALSQIIDMATELRNLILQRRNDISVSVSVFSQQLQSTWAAIAGQLNTNVEDRYVFGGARTDAPPVSEDFPNTVVAGEPDDSYYLGSNQDITAQVDDTISVTYNVRADAEGFQDLYAGIDMAAAGNISGQDADLERAYDLVSSAIQKIIATQATLGANKSTIDQATERQTGMQLYWKTIQESIINTDFISASTQVAIHQGILQASFSVFAKINSLSLVQFLR